MLTEEEKEIIEDIESTICPVKPEEKNWRGWIPLTWALNLLNEMKVKKLIGKCNLNPIL